MCVSEIMNVAQEGPLAGCSQQGSKYAGSLPGREFVQLIWQLLLKCGDLLWT